VAEMAAVVWLGRRDVRTQRWPLTDSVRTGWVRIRVAWCGLCGSDTTEYLRGPVVIPTSPHPLSGRQAPLVLGHEISGHVAAIGFGVGEMHVGDPVVTDALIPCEACSQCRGGEINLCPTLAIAGLSTDGGLADYVDVPATSCIRLPAGLPMDVAALAEPLAVAVRAHRQAGGEKWTSVIIGGGGVGLLLATLLSDHDGPVTLVEPLEQRRIHAHQLTEADTVASMRDLELPAAAPWVLFECSGSQRALADVIDVAPPGSRIVLVGVHGPRTPLDLHRFLHKELELVASLSHNRRDFRIATDLLAAQSVRYAALITHRTNLESAVSALHSLTTPDTTPGRVLVGPEGLPWTNS
jgi:(R,R)-butanediol dehydrogenase / meso-butanediol dehydrogenase / diacetyl reductase